MPAAGRGDDSTGDPLWRPRGRSRSPPPRDGLAARHV